MARAAEAIRTYTANQFRMLYDDWLPLLTPATMLAYFGHDWVEIPAGASENERERFHATKPAWYEDEDGRTVEVEMGLKLGIFMERAMPADNEVSGWDDVILRSSACCQLAGEGVGWLTALLCPTRSPHTHTDARQDDDRGNPYRSEWKSHVSVLFKIREGQYPFGLDPKKRCVKTWELRGAFPWTA